MHGQWLNADIDFPIVATQVGCIQQLTSTAETRDHSPQVRGSVACFQRVRDQEERLRKVQITSRSTFRRIADKLRYVRCLCQRVQAVQSGDYSAEVDFC